MVKQETNDVSLSCLRREKHRGHPICPRSQQTRPGASQPFANLQETSVRGVMEWSVTISKFRIIDGVYEAGVLFQEILHVRKPGRWKMEGFGGKSCLLPPQERGTLGRRNVFHANPHPDISCLQVVMAKRHDIIFHTMSSTGIRKEGGSLKW